MIIAGCAKGVVLLLLVTSSFSQNLDDTSKTLDASVHDPALASVQHRPSGSVGGRLRRWNPVPAVISNVKESKYSFFPQEPVHPPFFFPMEPARPPFVLPPYVVQFQTTTAAPTATLPITVICQLLAANAGITDPLAQQIFTQRCLILTGSVVTG